MFNFFRRKKNMGEEKKKRGSTKAVSTQKKTGAGEEEGPATCGKFATHQNTTVAPCVAIAARSPAGKTGELEAAGPPLPPKPTFGTSERGVVPNPSVVRPPSPRPVVMGNDYSQPLNTSTAVQNVHDIPFADCVGKASDVFQDASTQDIAESEVFSVHPSDSVSIDSAYKNSECIQNTNEDKPLDVSNLSTVSEQYSASLVNFVDKSFSENKPNKENKFPPIVNNSNIIKKEHNDFDIEHVGAKYNSSETTSINQQNVSSSIVDNVIQKLPNFESDPLNVVKSNLNLKNNANCDEASPANETEEEKSVTDNVEDYVLDLARKGPAASCEEYSSGNSPGSESNAARASSIDVTPAGDGEMYRVSSYPQTLEKTGGLKCVENYDKLKNGASENVFEAKGPLAKSAGETDLYKLSGICNDVNKSESDETSEDESSESEDTDSDNVIKNDSGCWDERDNSIFLSESENHVTTTASLNSVSSILRDGSYRAKKHVKWADIDGKKDLTYEKENTDTFVEGSSSEEEETEEEEEEEENTQDDNVSEESESEEEDESTQIKAEENKVNSVVANNENDYKREDTWLDMKSSSSGESEEEEEEEDEAPKSKIQVADKQSDNAEEESSAEESESEDESPEELSSEEDQVKDEPKTLRIDIAEMHNRIAELQKDVNMKSSNIDRLQVELDAACNESELVRQRFKKLEADLESYKQTNKELLQRIQATEQKEEEKVNKNNKQLEAAERQIKELETELNTIKLEYSNLQSSYKKLQADRDMEVQIIQKALEKALEGQEEMEAKYEKEFEKLRTLNSSREVQMLDDFEWKLREVERNCKKKMQEHETEFEKKSFELANQLAAAQADLEQISHLKLCEIELNQLKQTSSEQRKNLRLANRKLEELQVSEKILQEEVNSLRSSLDKEKAHIVNLQALHKDELVEKDKKMRLKLEYQIKQLTQEWEARLKHENNKIKTDLERISKEEKMVAVDLANKSKDKEIAQLKQNWDKKAQEFKNEIEKYKSKLAKIEEQRRTDLNNAQTNADRDVLDLRRKMDKLDMTYQEKIEKLQEQHEAELAAVKEDCDKRVQQSEANLQLQIGNSRTTLELVKQQLWNEAQAKIEKLENEYQQKLELQWKALKEEKDSAIAILEEKHQKALENIYKEIDKTKKQARNEQDSLSRKRNQQMSNQPSNRQVVAQQKNKNQEIEVGHFQNPLSGRLDVAEVAEEIRVQGKEEVLQRSIEQLTKQLNAGKMEIEKLRQQLEAREARQQQQHNQNQRNSQQPVPNPRRNRKGRSGRN